MLKPIRTGVAASAGTPSAPGTVPTLNRPLTSADLSLLRATGKRIAAARPGWHQVTVGTLTTVFDASGAPVASFRGSFPARMVAQTLEAVASEDEGREAEVGA